MSRTFSIAEQVVTDPVTGATVRFEVDNANSAIVRCRVYAAPESRDTPHSGDYQQLTFQRNGQLIRSEMVDAEVEDDARLRAEAQARLNRQGVAPVAATDEARKAAADAQAKQAADDQALLDSVPKVSKYALKPGDPGYVEGGPGFVGGPAGSLARGEFHQNPAILEAPGSNQPYYPDAPTGPRAGEPGYVNPERQPSTSNFIDPGVTAPQPGAPHGQDRPVGRPQNPVPQGR